MANVCRFELIDCREVPKRRLQEYSAQLCLDADCFGTKITTHETSQYLAFQDQDRPTDRI
jgi:hypothetical protein